MTDFLKIRVDSRDADRQIRLLAVGLTDLRPFWPRVVPLATGWWKRQFDTEGAFGGRPWSPLAASTVARKVALGRRTSILQETGQLRRAASQPERKASPRSLVLTIDDAGPEHGPVLQYHQEGEGVPERPLVFGSPLPPSAAMELEREAEAYVRDLIGRF